MCILSKLFGRRPKNAQNTVESLPPERSFDSTVSGFGNSAEAAQGGVPKVNRAYTLQGRTMYVFHYTLS